MTQAGLDSEEFKAAFFAQNTSGRAAHPEEIAGTLLHLCSDAASFINGALFVIDGGKPSITRYYSANEPPCPARRL